MISYQPQKDKGKEKRSVCLYGPLGQCQGEGTHHIPEERIESDGEDGSHKVGIQGVHVAQQPVHNAEVCLQDRAGISKRPTVPAPTGPHIESGGVTSSENSETKLPSGNTPGGLGTSKSRKGYYSTSS